MEMEMENVQLDGNSPGKQQLEKQAAPLSHGL